MKRRSLLFSSLVLAIALAVGVGCGKKPNDATISSAIQGKFGQDSGLSNKQLTVQANNGVVTLGGTVDDEAQREAASSQAASVAGVREVVNNLQVRNAPQATAAAAPVAAQISSGPIPARARADRAASVGRKSRRTRVSKDSDTAGNSANDSNSSQMSANSQPGSEAAPQIAEVSRSNAASAQAPPPPPTEGR